MGKLLVQRLPIYPAYAFEPDRWCAPDIATRVRRAIDAEGWAREDDWAPGLTVLPKSPCADARARSIRRSRDAVAQGSVRAHVSMRRRSCGCSPRATPTTSTSITAADALRQAVSGDVVRYVVNRNINYTNICYYPLPVLRLLQGQDARGPARRAVRSGARRSGAAVAGSLGARRHRSLPAGRHPSRLYRRDLSRHLPRDQGGGAGHARARVLAAGSDAGRGDARPVAARFPGAAEGRRPWHAAGHRRRDPRRRSARGHLPGQDQHGDSGSTW